MRLNLSSTQKTLRSKYDDRSVVSNAFREGHLSGDSSSDDHLLADMGYFDQSWNRVENDRFWRVARNDDAFARRERLAIRAFVLLGSKDVRNLIQTWIVR